MDILKKFFFFSIVNNIEMDIVVQLLNCEWLFVTPWTATHQVPLYPLPPGVCSNICPLSRWWYLTISSSAAPISFWFQAFPGSQSFPMAFHIRWPKYWSISISLSNEYSGLLSFQFEWLDLLAVQEILKSLLQHHSSKASIFWHSAYLMVQV